MTDRKKLIATFEQLLKTCEERQCDTCGHNHLDFPHCQSAYYADTILADGWVRLPCKVGDKVWYITGTYGTVIKSAVIDAITIERNGANELCVTNENGLTFWNSVDIFYPTKEEAEKALKECKGG